MLFLAIGYSSSLCTYTLFLTEGLKDPVLVRLDVDSKLSPQLKVQMGMGPVNPLILLFASFPANVEAKTLPE